MCRCVLMVPNKTYFSATVVLCRALDEFVVRGVGNNLQLLRSVVAHPSFRAGATTTAFLPQHLPQIFESRAARGVPSAHALLRVGLLGKRKA